MAKQQVYDVTTVFVHSGGQRSFAPLMLQPQEWAELTAAGFDASLRYGFTAAEAEAFARESLPYLNRAHADFLAEGGRILNEVDTFFG